MPFFQAASAKAQLIKRTSAIFSASGWRVEGSRLPDRDLILRFGQDDFVIFVQCIDQSVLSYASILDIVGECEGRSRAARFTRREPLIYVGNFALLDVDYLLKKEIIFFNITEINQVAYLPSIVGNLPQVLDGRATALLTSRYKILSMIHDDYLEKGDLESALKWAVDAQKWFPEKVGAYINVSSIYVRLNDTERAEQTISKGLEYHPRHPALLKQLASIVEKQGKLQESRTIRESLHESHRNRIRNYKTAEDFVRFHTVITAERSSVNVGIAQSLLRRLMSCLKLKARDG